jgi:hypothetical protein
LEGQSSAGSTFCTASSNRDIIQRWGNAPVMWVNHEENRLCVG